MTKVIRDIERAMFILRHGVLTIAVAVAAIIVIINFVVLC